MLRRLVVILPLGLLVLAGCGAQPATPTAATSTTSASATPTPQATVEQAADASPTPTPTATPVPELILGYPVHEVVAACIPAVEANYPGGVIDPLPTGVWLQGDLATVEFQTYVGTVSWTSNTDFTFPALCVISATDGSGPIVTYVGVADL